MARHSIQHTTTVSTEDNLVLVFIHLIRFREDKWHTERRSMLEFTKNDLDCVIRSDSFKHVQITPFNSQRGCPLAPLDGLKWIKLTTASDSGVHDDATVLYIANAACIAGRSIVQQSPHVRSI